MSGTRHSRFAPSTTTRLPPFWEELRTASGLVYYKNAETKATSWDRPVPKRVASIPTQTNANSNMGLGSLVSLDLQGGDQTAAWVQSLTSPSIASSRSTSASSIPQAQSPISQAQSPTPQARFPFPDRYRSPSVATPSISPQISPRITPANPFMHSGRIVNEAPKPTIRVARPVHQSEVGQSKANGRECIIGIDFGTTFSSCCYYARDSEKAVFRKDGLQQIIQWGVDQGTLENIPSQLLYDGNKVISWGNIPESEPLAHPNSLLVKWFKLHLKTSSELISGPYNQGLQSSRTSYPLPMGMRVRQVITDYLYRLRIAILDSLDRQLKEGIAGYSASFM